MEIVINNIIKELRDGELDIYENGNKYIYIKEDVREDKTIPYELSNHGITGYERGERDLSNSLIY
jgi:hypothetical protein